MGSAEEPPEPVFTFELFWVAGPPFVGGLIAVYLSFVMWAEKEREGALILFVVGSFWIAAFAALIYIRARRVWAYRRRRQDDPA